MKSAIWNSLRALPSGAVCVAFALLLSLTGTSAATDLGSRADRGDGAGPGAPFITTWKTDNPGDSGPNQIAIPIEGSGYDFTVDWGDGEQTPWQDGDDLSALTHTYDSPGTYSVAISGAFPRIFVNFGGDRQKILTVAQWGDISWSTMERAFYGARNLQVVAADAPDLSSVTSMAGMFAVTDAFNGDIGDWDVSHVTDMTALFASADAFNQDIGGWNVSSVTNMREMFAGTDVFDQNISDWDVSGVVDMGAMFRSTGAFNQDIGSWNVSSVNFMDEMFSGAGAFNQAIGGWDVTGVTTMSEMFFEASAFDQSLAGWDVSNVTVMSYMFEDATSFNQPIGGWNVSNVTAMNYMFSGATAFNQDIGNWDVSSVTNMYSMFGEATVFDQDIGGWNVSSVDNMTFMFFRAAAFNQDIGDWDVSNVTHMPSMFREATAFNQDIGDWDVSSVTDTAWMFARATAFDQDIGNWNLSSVTDTVAMFNGASSFNQDIGTWDVSGVTNSAFMFQDASAFNQDLSGWDVSSITDMNGMFAGATAFNQDISDWDVSGVGFMVQMFQDATSFNQDIGDWDVSNVSGMVQMFSGASAFDQDLGGWDVSNAAFMIGLFDNSGLSTASYDGTLVGWAAQSVQADAEMGAAGLAYCAGADARQSLIDDHGWNITGDVLDCGEPTEPDIEVDPASLASSLQPGQMETQALTLANAGTVALDWELTQEGRGFGRVDGLALATGEDSSTAAVIDPAGDYVYFGTNTTPGRVVKIDLETFEPIGAITLEAGEGGLVSALIDATGDFAYFGTTSAPGRVIKIDLATFARVDALTLSDGENSLTSAVLDPAGGHAYFGTNTAPGRVVKIDLETFARVAAITLAGNQIALQSAVIDSAGAFAYFGTVAAPGTVVKIDLETFAAVDALPLANGLVSAVIDPADGFAYFGTTASPGQVWKIDLASFADAGTLTFDTGESSLSAATIDAAGGFAYFGTFTTPGQIVKIDLAAFARVDAVTLASGEDSLFSAVVDGARGYAYFGTSTVPGRVVKIDVGAELDCTVPEWLAVAPLAGSVPADGEQVVDVTFDASGLASGDYAANLCIASNDPQQPLTVVPASLTVTGGGPPVLAFEPTSLDFGDVAVGTTSPPQSATLHNSGGEDTTELAFNDISPSGFDVDTDDCGTSLPAGESCQVVVTFTPPVEGPINPTLVASTPGVPPGLLQLSGNGVLPSPPTIDVDPESLSATLLQGAMETQSLTITNLGDEELEWLIPDLSQFGDNVKALTVWDDGSGPALYVGGRSNTEFGGIARWDGVTWSLLGAGMNDDVEALNVFDGALIAAGRFTEVDGVPVNYLARWDGSQWSALGDGVSDDVYGLTVYDGALIASGLFTEAGGQPANRIARWDGSDWSPLGTGMDNRVTELTVYEGALHAGGWFTEAGGVPASRVARWDGTQWSPLGAGVGSLVHAMTVYDGKLIAGGRFEEAGGIPAERVASWDGNTWAALGTGIPGGTTTQVDMLTVFDGALIAGGRFVEAGGVDTRNIARWDGSAWSALGPGLSGHVSAGALFDGALIAGGQFNFAGELPTRGIARWDGTAWSALVTEISVCDVPVWLQVDPTEGSIASGDSQPVSVTFDANDLPLGEHQANLCLLTNDPDDLLVMVPVELTVLAAPAADIAPESFTFTLPQGESADDVLDIGNVGAADLEWTIGAVASDLVVFDDIDFTVPATQRGGSVRWDTGETCECDDEPFNFNMWRTATDGNLAFFWPGQEEAGGGGVSLDGSRYAVLGPGDTVGPHSEFIRSTPTDATFDWRQVAGVDGRLGFRFVNPTTQEVNYGHARIETTGISGHPATVVGWVYDQSGNSIAVGGCTDPAEIPWLTVDPLDGTTPPAGSVPVDITVDTVGLEPGLHQEQFCITTNDPAAPLVAIPVEVTVLGEQPVVEVTPDALALEAPQGGSDQETVNVGNAGTVDLEWSLAEAAAGGGDDVVADGGFEAGTPSPVWEEGSTNFGTPLCDASCGVNGAHSGSWWAWFGGISDVAESGFVRQEVMLPANDNAELRFWLLIADAFVGGRLDVSLDGDVLFSVTDQEADAYSVYTEVVVDVSTYADGATHELAFEGETEAGSGITSFFVDDVSLLVGAGGGCANPSDIPWLSATPAAGSTPPDGGVPVTVAADAADLEPGAHQAQLCLTSNDPATPLVEIPVSLDVTGGSKWSWQNPLPQGNLLHDVAFSDADNVVAVGAHGAIVRTADGGATWLAQNSGTTAQLNGVTLVDAIRGVAVGAGGTILATTDGGAAWVPRTSGTANDLHSVAFPDPEHGIAVGSSGTVLTTSDGGVTWTPQTSGTGSELRDVAFTDVDTGTAVGASGTILRTTDGGATWVPQESGTTNTLSAVAFTDGSTGTVVGSGGRILKTIDGGATWVPQISGVSSTLHDVAFADTDNGWAVGFPSLILHTSNGGATWEQQPSSANNALLGVAAVTADLATAVGPVGFILRTVDGGATWENQLPGTTDSLVGVSFTDAQTGTAVGNDGRIVRTIDAGSHWVPQDSGTATPLRGVFFSDADHGTAVGEQGLILRTTDGGATWNPQTSGTASTLRGVHFRDTEAGTVVGFDGTILTTIDGGTTWVARVSDTTHSLYDVSFADADHGMAVGGGATVLETTDGGVTWSPQDTGSTTNIYAGVSFIDPQTATIVGLNMFGTDSRIFRTSDGGSIWIEQEAGTTSALNGVFFLDADNGTAVGGGGTILSTTDGGQTWVHDDSRTTNILYDVVFTGPAHGTAVGFGGTILRCCGSVGELNLTPDPLDFGEVSVGETGGPLSLTLTSTGTVDVTVSELSGPGAPFAPAGGTCDAVPFTLAVGASCTLDFTFAPTAEGEAASDVTITSDAPSSPHLATLRGFGVAAGGPELVLEPASLVFGDVPVGTSASLSTTLHNTGEAAANGLTATLDPADNGFAADIGDCGDTLPAGESCTVGVTFSPLAAGAAAATLLIASDEGPSAAAELSGNGVGDGGFTPMALEVDPQPLSSDGNRVFEPGEQVDVAPAWRNDGATAHELGGNAAAFTGPEGADYTIAGPAADYGLIEPGATVSCLETGVCYALEVDDPAARPADHWDAAFDESLDDTAGTTRTWTMHLGGSFVDAPKTNIFYSAIETLLHSGVTGGCTETAYCSAGVNSRAQMAVFMLKAADGPDYEPPACVDGAEMFGDVLFDNAFCPWIEELARRNVVAGCGSGNYCPGDPVSRAQMAVFLLKSLEGGDYTPPTCDGVFDDVTCPSLFADWIEDLAARGITGGCSETAYCPADPVSRAQMAAFVTKTFGLALYGP